MIKLIYLTINIGLLSYMGCNDLTSNTGTSNISKTGSYSGNLSKQTGKETSEESKKQGSSDVAIITSHTDVNNDGKVQETESLNSKENVSVSKGDSVNEETSKTLQENYKTVEKEVAPIETDSGDTHLTPVVLNEYLCKVGSNDDYENRYTFADKSKEVCERKLFERVDKKYLEKIGQATSCSIGSACDAKILSATSAFGACIHTMACDEDVVSANKARQLFMYLWGRLPSKSESSDSSESGWMQGVFGGFCSCRRQFVKGDYGFIINLVSEHEEAKKFLSQKSNLQFVELLLQSINLDIKHPLSQKALKMLEDKATRRDVVNFIGSSAEFNEYCRE